MPPYRERRASRRSARHPVIDKIGAWRLRPFQMEQVTTNQAESFNYVIKQLQVHQCRNVLSPTKLLVIYHDVYVSL